MSSLIASTSLRRFSACLVRSLCSSMRVSLVTPSTSRATSAPNWRPISFSPTAVSSATSCRSAVAMVAVSSRWPARMPATASGWVM
jgi:hypothetical protein